MSFKIRISLAVLAILLIAGGMWASAQVRQEPGNPGTLLDLAAPTVITGNDLGFQIESYRNNIAVGRMVVRIDGHWVDAQVGGNGVLLTSTR